MTQARAMDATEWDDWITIWHSEMAAAVTDREAQEATLRLLDLWAAAARGAARGLEPATTPGPDAPPGSAPAAAAPGAGHDARITDLLARVAELERRSGPS